MNEYRSDFINLRIHITISMFILVPRMYMYYHDFFCFTTAHPHNSSKPVH